MLILFRYLSRARIFFTPNIVMLPIERPLYSTLVGRCIDSFIFPLSARSHATLFFHLVNIILYHIKSVLATFFFFKYEIVNICKAIRSWKKHQWDRHIHMFVLTAQYEILWKFMHPYKVVPQTMTSLYFYTSCIFYKW